MTAAGYARLRLGGPFSALAVLLAAAAPQALAAGDSRTAQEIVFAEMPTHWVDDPPFDVSVHASSGLPVAVRLISGPAVLEGKSVRLTGEAGLVILRASQTGNDAFQPAVDAERAFAVRRRPSAPSLLMQPAAVAAAVGDPLILSAAASGEPEPSFQWRKDGQPIAGATQRMLSVPSAKLSDAGTYDVVVSNPAGAVTSGPARVTVGKRSQSIVFQSQMGTVPSGQSVALVANATSGLPVRLQVVSGPGSLAGNVLTSGGGTVIVEADQPGDSTFEPAQPVTEVFLFSTGPGTR